VGDEILEVSEMWVEKMMGRGARPGVTDDDPEMTRIEISENSRAVRRKDREGRPSRANGRATRAAVREKAIDLFYQYGYRNASLRTLAGQVGLQAGSLYNHITNKQELLFHLLKEIMEEVLEMTYRRLRGKDSAVVQLHEFVESHLEFHTTRLKEISIGNSELRNLEPENYKAIVALRREYFSVIHNIIKSGVEQKVFHVKDSKTAARVIIGTLNSVSGWYKVGGGVSLRELSDIYLAMIFRALGAPRAISESPAASAPRVPRAAKRAKPKRSRSVRRG
jgi:AcrR family transcriptional regulator